MPSSQFAYHTSRDSCQRRPLATCTVALIVGMRVLSLLVIASSLLPSVHAGIDDTYYPGNVHNILVQQDQYYKDAINVLEDLSAFQSLFVEYHSCTYVKMPFLHAYYERT